MNDKNYPLHGPAIPCGDLAANLLVDLRQTFLKASKARLTEDEAALEKALRQRGAYYVCRKCAEKSLYPLGVMDENQCGPCFNGVNK